jgi:hypothetical protein
MKVGRVGSRESRESYKAEGMMVESLSNSKDIMSYF